jgi:methylated-DNA-[protein]-cysteine S-methyltransferase
MDRAFTTFETTMGTCGIAWNVEAEPRIVGFQLPEVSPASTAKRIARRTGTQTPAAPPPAVARIIERVRAHVNGDTQDFSDVAVDLSELEEFPRAVLTALREIPAGRTGTYGELAKALNQPTAAQAVGKALGRNPIPLIIPCHRILAAGGKTGGFSAHGGWVTKSKLLALEGAQTGGLPLFDS